MKSEIIKVLLVEDNEPDALSIKDTLAFASYGSYSIDWVQSLSEASEKFPQGDYQIVLLDLTLPDGHGLETVKRMVNMAEGKPIVMLTGLADEDTAISTVREGAQDYLIKGEINEALLCRSINYAIERNKSERALKNSEELLRTIFNNVPIGVYRTTPDGKIIMVNRSMALMLGYDSSEELMQCTTNCFYDEQEFSRDAFQSLVESKNEVLGLEHCLKKRDGSLLYVLENAKSTRDEKGQVVYYEGTIQDISLVKLARMEKEAGYGINKSLLGELDIENAMINFSRELSKCIDHDLIGLVTIQKESDIAYCVLAVRDNCGKEGEAKYSTVNFCESYKGSFAQKIIQDKCEKYGVLSDRTNSLLTSRLIAEGTVTYLSIPIFHGGIPLGVLIVARKGTEKFPDRHTAFIEQCHTVVALWLNQLKTIDLLSESESKFRDLFNRSTDAIFILKCNQLVLVNRKFEEIFGYSQAELEEQQISFLQLIAPESHPAFTKRLEAIKLGHSCPPCFEYKGLTKSGSILDLELVTSRVIYEDSPAVQGLIRDISERKNNEKTRQEMQMKLMEQAQLASIGMLAAGIAHNINTPLQALITHLELYKLMQPGNQAMDTMLEQTAQISSIVNNLLTKARNDQNQQVRDIDLNRLIEQEMSFLDADLTCKHCVEKEFALDPSLPNIKGIYSDFSQSLINIIKNAIDAMHGTSRKVLTIKTQASESDGIVIEIGDTGVGITPELLPKIFHPFFTTKPMVHENRDDEPTGTGLGLSSATQLLNKYQAKIAVDSEVGRGTTFRITIPTQDSNHVAPLSEADHESFVITQGASE
jgi:PAS domain S-box-containing protein